MTPAGKARGGEIAAVFRQDDPPGRLPGVAWVAELHSADDTPPFPLATAYLSDFTGSLMDCVVLDFILVPDQLRGRGYARRLVEACVARWPALVLTEPISGGGEALTAALLRDGVVTEATL